MNSIQTDPTKLELSKAAQAAYDHIGEMTKVNTLKFTLSDKYDGSAVDFVLNELKEKGLVRFGTAKDVDYVGRTDVDAPSDIPEPRTAPQLERPTSPVQSEPRAETAKGSRSQIKPKCLYRKPTSQNEHHKAIEKMFSLSLQVRMYGVGMHTLCYAQTSRDDLLSPSREITPEYLARYLGVPNVDRAQKAAKALVEAGLFIRIDSQKGGRPRKRVGNNPGSGAVYRPVVPDYGPS